MTKTKLIVPVFIMAAAMGGVFPGLSVGKARAEAEELKSVEISEMVVTATRGEEDAATVPSNITVIRAEEIAESGAMSIVDVLKNLAGINVADWTGSGRTASVDIRGFGERSDANTLVVVDGRRINPPDMSGIDWTIIPLDRIDRIEVIRGGGSVIYGNHATGGVINIITKKVAEEHTASAGLSIGSYDYFNQSFGFAGSTKRLFYNVHGNYMKTDGYRDNSDFRNKSAGVYAGFLEDWYGIDVSAGIKDDSYGLPGSIIEGEQQRTYASTPEDFAESRNQYARITPRVMFTDGSEFSMAFNMRKLESYYDIYDYGLSPQYNKRFDFIGMPHNIVAGFDYQYSKMKSDRADNTRWEAGIFIHDKINFAQNVYVNFGYRGTRVSYDIDNGPDDSFDIHAATAGLTYNYAFGSKAFISAERGFRTALLDEQGGEDFDEILDPQISIHYQAGISHRVNQYALVGATAFHIDTKDEILFNPALPSWFNGQNDNYDRTRRRGFELEMVLIPHEKIRLSGNYTFMKNELRGGEFGGNDIPGVARHSAAAGATIFPVSGLSFDMRSRWADGKTMITDWENEVGDDWDGGSYTVVDTRASYQWKVLTVSCGVNNVFNEKYSEYGVWTGDRQIYPAPERNYYGEIRIAGSL